MQAASIRNWLKPLVFTPLHPQWLLSNSKKRTGTWIGQNAGGVVLDIGCADQWVNEYIPENCQYISLDYPMTGGKMYGSRPALFADAARLPLQDGVVDTILMLEVLEHLRTPVCAIAEVARVLKPGGVLLLTVPFLYPVHDAPHDYQRPTCYGLLRDLERAGLIVEPPTPTLGSAETAALLCNLALGGMYSTALTKRHPALLLLPLLSLMVPLINIGGRVLGRMLPSWPALTAGYSVKAYKK
jgi:SAM-dependent methyltransferase